MARPDRLRIGLYGQLGSGNLGNDASLESVLGFLRRRQPDAVVDAMTTCPEELSAAYGIPAVPLSWQHPWRHPFERSRTRLGSLLLLGAGKLSQAVRTVRWVRAHDVVIVPGAGVLETSLRLRPWEAPYALLLLCAGARLVGTRVALLAVGAEVLEPGPSGRLLTAAARRAGYRSYRDERSRSAMRTNGVDVDDDHVFADLAFALPVPEPIEPEPGTVGIGVMAYTGRNQDDAAEAARVRAAYEQAMTRLVGELVDSGRRVQLLIGDHDDYPVADAILAEVRSSREYFNEESVTFVRVRTFSELIAAMGPLAVVVAARFHNVVAALMLAKPTISVDYADKTTDLMAEVGLAQYSHPIRSIDAGRALAHVVEVEQIAEQLRAKIAERALDLVELTRRQYEEAAVALFGSAGE